MSQQEHKPTMKDVARLAGVSYQTVSCVVNNIPVVKEETRQKVLQAIQELNYTPDATARSLRSGKSRMIGLMIPDAHNPFFWQIVAGAEDEANKSGYSLLLSTTSMNLERETSVFQALLAERLDGIILLFTYPEKFIDELRKLWKKGFPFVTFNIDSRMLEADTVRVHYENTARELMEHLIALGHRRIAMICGIGRAGLGSDRVRAYHLGLEQAGITPDPRYFIITGSTLQDGFEAAQNLLALDPPPTAIIGINDLIAFGAMQAALRRGLRVPADLSIAGFDDIQMSDFLSPPLTTGRADGQEIGRQTARLLLQRLQDPGMPPQRVHLSTHLMIRGSTGPAKAGP